MSIASSDVPALPERLVILLHGVGGTGAGLLSAVRSWQDSLPRTRFVAPDAPYTQPNRPGHHWFGLDGQELRPDRIRTIRDAFDDLIGSVIKREGFEGHLSDVAFVGVSQGAIVALDAAASGRWRVGAIVSFAGLLPPFAISQVSHKTPVLLVHGQEDLTIPCAASAFAAARLKAAGFNVTLKVLPRVGHTVSVEAADAATVFLRDALLKLGSEVSQAAPLPDVP